MGKLTVFIEGGNKEVQVNESILVSVDSRHLLGKTAVMYWNYNNVFTGFNVLFIGIRCSVTLIEGYWSFQMFAN